jgi:hypothetical protein
MKANELRIGNLLLDRGDKVLRLDYWDFMKPAQRMFIEDSEVHPLTEDLQYCKPIPLTEEWLLKFGFNRRQIKDLISYNTNQLQLYQYASNNNKIFFEYADGEVQLKYVHQLQNLHFALTGMELKCAVRKLNK